MSSIDWNNLQIEHYIIGTLALICLLFIITLLLSVRKRRGLQKKAIADKIDLEESGKHEKWFSVFTKTIPQVFWIRGNAITHFVSPHFEDLTGHKEFIINDFPTGIYQICHPDDLSRIKEQHEAFALAETAQLDLNFRINKSGSKYIWIRERIFNHCHISGEMFQVGSMEDITNKQIILEEINDQKLLFNNILASTDEGIFCLDRSFKFIYWNQEMESITGMKHDDLIQGSSIFDTFPHLEENGSAVSIRLALEGKTAGFKTYPYHLTNNRKGFTDEKYLPLTNSHGDIIGVIGIVKDVSEELARDNVLEKTQERYGLTLRAVNDGIWDWDLKSNSLIFSDRWFTMLGYTESELSSSLKTLLSLLYTDEDKEVLKVGRDALVKGDPIEIEVQMIHKTGKTVWMLIRGKCIESDKEGNALRAIGTQTDITERKTFELDLIKSKEKAEESDRLKSAFLANMSHEIRTPLNAIVGFTDLLTSEEAPTAEDKLLGQQQIQKNSQNLTHLIEDIILMSRFDSGQYPVQNENFDLIDLMKETATSVYIGFGKEKAEKVGLKLQIPPGISKFPLESDQSLFQSAISHLLKNALYYTNQGQVSLGLKIMTDKELEIFVRDTGVGIKSEDLEKIFRQFEQLNQGLTRTHEGAGLGLSLVKKIVQLIKGDIKIKSEQGKGSCFSIIIPYQIPSDKP